MDFKYSNIFKDIELCENCITVEDWECYYQKICHQFIEEQKKNGQLEVENKRYKAALLQLRELPNYTCLHEQIINEALEDGEKKTT